MSPALLLLGSLALGGPRTLEPVVETAWQDLAWPTEDRHWSPATVEPCADRTRTQHGAWDLQLGALTELADGWRVAVDPRSPNCFYRQRAGDPVWRAQHLDRLDIDTTRLPQDVRARMVAPLPHTDRFATPTDYRAIFFDAEHGHLYLLGSGAVADLSAAERATRIALPGALYATRVPVDATGLPDRNARAVAAPLWLDLLPAPPGPDGVALRLPGGVFNQADSRAAVLELFDLDPDAQGRPDPSRPTLPLGITDLAALHRTATDLAAPGHSQGAVLGSGLLVATGRPDRLHWLAADLSGHAVVEGLAVSPEGTPGDHLPVLSHTDLVGDQLARHAQIDALGVHHGAGAQDGLGLLLGTAGPVDHKQYAVRWEQGVAGWHRRPLHQHDEPDRIPASPFDFPDPEGTDVVGWQTRLGGAALLDGRVWLGFEDPWQCRQGTGSGWTAVLASMELDAFRARFSPAHWPAELRWFAWELSLPLYDQVPVIDETGQTHQVALPDDDWMRYLALLKPAYVPASTHISGMQGTLGRSFRAARARWRQDKKGGTDTDPTWFGLGPTPPEWATDPALLARQKRMLAEVMEYRSRWRLNLERRYHLSWTPSISEELRQGTGIREANRRLRRKVPIEGVLETVTQQRAPRYLQRSLLTTVAPMNGALQLLIPPPPQAEWSGRQRASGAIAGACPNGSFGSLGPDALPSFTSLWPDAGFVITSAGPDARDAVLVADGLPPWMAVDHHLHTIKPAHAQPGEQAYFNTYELRADGRLVQLTRVFAAGDTPGTLAQTRCELASWDLQFTWHKYRQFHAERFRLHTGLLMASLWEGRWLYRRPPPTRLSREVDLVLQVQRTLQDQTHWPVLAPALGATTAIEVLDQDQALVMQAPYELRAIQALGTPAPLGLVEVPIVPDAALRPRLPPSPVLLEGRFPWTYLPSMRHGLENSLLARPASGAPDSALHWSVVDLQYDPGSRRLYMAVLDPERAGQRRLSVHVSTLEQPFFSPVLDTPTDPAFPAPGRDNPASGPLRWTPSGVVLNRTVRGEARDLPVDGRPEPEGVQRQRQQPCVDPSEPDCEVF